MDLTFLPEPTQTLSGENSIALTNGQIHSPTHSFGWCGTWMLKLHSGQDQDGWTGIEPPSAPSPRAAFEFKLPDNLALFTSSRPLPKKPRQHQGMGFFVALKDGARYKPWPWPMYASRGAHGVAIDYLTEHSQRVANLIADMPLPATSLKEVLDGRPVSPFLPLDLAEGLRARFERERFFGLALYVLHERTQEPITNIKIGSGRYTCTPKNLEPTLSINPDQGNYQLQQKVHRPFLRSLLDKTEHPTSAFWNLEKTFENLSVIQVETVDLADISTIDMAEPTTAHEHLTAEHLRQELDTHIANLPQEILDLL